MADLSFIGETKGTELQKMMEYATKRKLNSAAHIEGLANGKNSEISYIADIAKQAQNLGLSQTLKMIKSMYAEEAEHEQTLREIAKNIKK